MAACGDLPKPCLICPITALSFVEKLLLTGEGPRIGVYSTVDGKKLQNINALGHSRVHGIRENDGTSMAVIFGQKVLRILKITSVVEFATGIITLPDLVLDAQWLNGKTECDELVAIATAHNAVWCIDWASNTKWLVAQCEENCILYSARFHGNTLETLALASGTVFNQILLWPVNGPKGDDNKSKISQRAAGHDGVIFSLSFNTDGSMLGSVSDDRSIRLWNVPDLSESEVECILVIYGHTARVWDVRLLEEVIVSIGEDAACNVWNYKGEMIKSFTGHKGRSIWSLATDEKAGLMATGGGDCSIRFWSLQGLNRNSSMVTMETVLPGSLPGKRIKKNATPLDSPRCVAIATDNDLLVMTSYGSVFKYHWQSSPKERCSPHTQPDKICDKSPEDIQAEDNDSWQLLLEDVHYSSYSLMAVSPDKRLVAFGNLQGCIKVHDTDFSLKAIETKAYSSKVLSLLWCSYQSHYNLFSCGPDGHTIWWKVEMDTDKGLHVNQLRSFSLPYSKQRWPSAAAILCLPHPLSRERKGVRVEKERGEEVMEGDREKKGVNQWCAVLLGDRKGSIHLYCCYDANKVKNLQQPVHTLPVIHGRAGVTHLGVHGNHVYSAGRDGTYRQIRVHPSRLELIDTRKVFKGVEWVERIIFTDDDVIIAAFYTAYFILWSVNRNQPLFKVKCGGGHRAWDVALSTIRTPSQIAPGEKVALFTYLKGNNVNMSKVVLRNPFKTPILKEAFHGREATCLCYVGMTSSLRSDEQRHVFVTGSEDTTINLMTHDPRTGHVSRIFTAQGHISSVRALAISRSARKTSHVLTPYRRDITGGCHASKTNRHAMASNPNVTSRGVQSSDSYLMFSGGGRASLKCWRIDLSALRTGDCHGNNMTSSPVTYLAEYSPRLSKHRRRRRKKNEHLYSEIRFMALTAFSLSDVITDDGVIDRCQSLHGVVAACSDGFVRLFVFDEAASYFSLLAQSTYLTRCALSIRHVIHPDEARGHHVFVFCGDTAGRISVWDVTRHIREFAKPADQDDYDDNDDDETGKLEEYARWIDYGMTADGDDDLGGDQDKADITQIAEDSTVHERGTSSVVQKHGDISLSVKDTEEDRTLLKSSPCESTSLKCDLASEEPRDQSAISTSEEGGRLTSDQPSDQSSFSCISLAQDTLGSPLWVLKTHQSGVNDISIKKGSDHYVLCSGGDDSAIYVCHFTLSARGLHVIKAISLPSAHTSSVTGVAVLDDRHLTSVSTDQRVKIWEVSESQEGPQENVEGTLKVELKSETFVDVPDVQALETWQLSNRGVAIVVCGVGLQSLHFAEQKQN